MRVTFPDDGYNFFYNPSNDHVINVHQPIKLRICKCGCGRKFRPYPKYSMSNKSNPGGEQKYFPGCANAHLKQLKKGVLT